MRICDLRCKEVINTKDCRILGFVCDIDFDMVSGCIKALIVPGPARLFGCFGRDIEYVIPFRCVINVGPDAILVDVCLERITEKCF